MLLELRQDLYNTHFSEDNMGNAFIQLGYVQDKTKLPTSEKSSVCFSEKTFMSRSIKAFFLQQITAMH